MALPLPSPSALLEFGRYAAGQVLESAASLATVPVRVIAVLGQAELLVSRITVIAEQAEALVQRVGAIADDAQAVTTAAAVAVEEAATVGTAAARVVEGAALTTDAANAVVTRAAAASADAVDLIDGYAPTLRQAAPLAARFVAELTPDEVTAAIRMVDELPKLREHLVDDVMPLLSKLDQVGPDLHKLLEVTEDLRLAIAGLPGLRMLRRRGEDRMAEESD